MGICLEFPGLMTIYPLIREKMPRGGSFYKLAMYVYLAVGGGAVHLPCGAIVMFTALLLGWKKYVDDSKQLS